MEKRHGSSGFTLIELMIAVAIVGILAAFAYPAYEKSLMKGRRATAKSFLMDVAQKEQQFLMDGRVYSASFTSCNAAAFGLGLISSASDTELSKNYRDLNKYYTCAVTTTAAAGGAPPSFTATATPYGKQASDNPLSITNTGQKTGNW